MKAGDEVWLKVTVNEVEDGIVEFYHHDYCVSVSEKDLLTDEEVLKELVVKAAVPAGIEHMADIRDEFSRGDWEKIKANHTPDNSHKTFKQLWRNSMSARALLYGAFMWSASPEGSIYWREVSNNLD